MNPDDSGDEDSPDNDLQGSGNFSVLGSGEVAGSGESGHPVTTSKISDVKSKPTGLPNLVKTDSIVLFTDDDTVEASATIPYNKETTTPISILNTKDDEDSNSGSGSFSGSGNDEVPESGEILIVGEPYTTAKVPAVRTKPTGKSNLVTTDVTILFTDDDTVSYNEETNTPISIINTTDDEDIYTGSGSGDPNATAHTKSNTDTGLPSPDDDNDTNVKLVSATRPTDEPGQNNGSNSSKISYVFVLSMTLVYLISL